MGDIERLRNEYENRKRRLSDHDIYSWFNPSNLFAIHTRQRAILSTLKRNGYSDIKKYKILEIGCGGGGVLTEYLGFGASAKNLFGVDLLLDRLQHAHESLQLSTLVNADGQTLPFRSHSFDLVLQSTALSSILDFQIRQRVCAEMIRMLKPNGLILSYDFWVNPLNPQTHGIRPSEIKQLFPHCKYQFQRITLAPPITRKLISISWILCLLLENLKILNTHFLVTIRPKTD